MAGAGTIVPELRAALVQLMINASEGEESGKKGPQA